MGFGQAQQFLSRFKQLVENKPVKQSFVFFPPMGLAGLFQKEDFLWGGQNAHDSPKGAWTGENSALLLKEMGADFCLVGHSERRLCFKESDQDAEKKFRLLYDTGLIPVLCVGEGLEDRAQKQRILKRQLLFLKKSYQEKAPPPALTNSERGRSEAAGAANQKTPLEAKHPRKSALSAIEPSKEAKKPHKESKPLPRPGFIVAYEPVWAIGSGKTPSVQEIEESAGFIKEYAGLPDLRALYGGSVNKALAKEFSKKATAIDGFLIGGASLDPDSLYEIYLLSCQKADGI